MSSSNKDTAIRYLRLLEQGDHDGMRALCTEKATVWHNDGKGEQSIEDNLAMLKQIAGGDSKLRYEIIRQLEAPNEVLQQHVLRITNSDGPAGEVLAAMYFGFENGLIRRIEEYANFVPHQ